MVYISFEINFNFNNTRLWGMINYLIVASFGKVFQEF